MATAANRKARVAPASSGAHKALAQAAIGRGVRHSVSFNGSSTHREDTDSALSATSHALRGQGDALLSELTFNYKTTLNELLEDVEPNPVNLPQPPTQFLSRDSSLVDLAMIPPVEADGLPVTEHYNLGLNFTDFPNPEVQPPTEHGRHN